MRKIRETAAVGLSAVAGLGALAAAAAPVVASAQSAGPDYSTLTANVDFGTTQTALLSIGALVVTLALLVVGIRKIVRMVRGA